jgi:phage tail-like protein
MPQNDYPLPGFHFLVEFGISEGQDSYDNYFQSVSGLTVEINTDTIREGGENRFEHQVPVRTKYGTLVLKRGVLKETDIIKWCRKAIEDYVFEPTTVTIKLLGEKHNPLITWNLTHVWPKKWDIADLDASKNEVLVETLELNYNFFTVTYSS